MNMRKVLATALALVATSMAAYAQKAEVLELRPLPIPETPVAHPPADPPLSGSAVEAQYGWPSRHYIYFNDAGDTVINNWAFPIPTPLGKNAAGDDYVLCGVGQLFAPGVIYNYFNTFYDSPDTADLVFGRAVIDQFKDALDYTVDSISVLYYKNPAYTGGASHTLKFYVWSTPPSVGNSYFTSTGGTYRTNGFNFGRSSLVEKFSVELSSDGIDTTLDDNGFIRPTVMGFDPPLSFNAGAAAIGMLVNENGEAITPQAGETREYQRMFGTYEGNRATKHRLQTYKTWGMTILRTILTSPDVHYADSIRSIWSTVFYGTPPDSTTGVIDMRMTFVGTVNLKDAGVAYHFGTDATSQGLNAVTPNPARETAKVNFSLTEIAPVTLDLYNATGEKIRTLVTARYIPGVYSYELPVSDLQSGTYLVRMTAGEKVYTTKVNVVK
jgi:hypothetical protein